MPFKDYTDRVLTETPMILGLKLKPFSLGHSLILKKNKSIYINGNFGDFNTLINELVFAALVCSTSYDEFENEVHNGTFKNELKKYVKFLNKNLGTKKNWLKRLFKIVPKNPINIFAENAKFIEYLKQGTATQNYYKTEDSSIKNNPVEFEESIKETLMTECNYTRDEILNLPFTEILAAFQLYAHKQGVITLESKAEFELKERLKGKGN